MSSVPVPSDRRFRRPHVKPSRQRSSWKKSIGRSLRAIAIGAVLLYGAYRGAAAVTKARVLVIDRINVHGNERMSTGEVLAVLNGLRGENLLFADLPAWRNRLLSSPWIHEADLRRQLPSTVEVVVVERQPVGIGRINGQLYLVDGRGVLVDEYGPQYADLDLPIIDGLPDPGEGGTTDPARIDLAARVFAAVKAKPDIAKRVSQIDVRDPHNASVILTGEAEVLQIGDTDFLRRLESYVDLAPTLRSKVNDIDVVDLRFDGRVYVTPTGRGLKTRASGAKAVR
jgi:cell division protein FtsQ